MRAEHPRLRHVGFGNHVRNDARVATVVLGDTRHGTGDVRVFRKPRLDLSQLYAVPADLDLRVQPSQVLQRAVVAPTSAIAGSIQPRARLSRSGLSKKRWAVSFGWLTYPDGKPVAADEKLAGRTDRQRL